MRSEQELKDKINAMSEELPGHRIGSRAHTTLLAARNALAWVLSTGVYQDPMPSAEELTQWRKHDEMTRPPEFIAINSGKKLGPFGNFPSEDITERAKFLMPSHTSIRLDTTTYERLLLYNVDVLTDGKRLYALVRDGDRRYLRKVKEECRSDIMKTV